MTSIHSDECNREQKMSGLLIVLALMFCSSDCIFKNKIKVMHESFVHRLLVQLDLDCW